MDNSVAVIPLVKEPVQSNEKCAECSLRDYPGTRCESAVGPCPYRAEREEAK